MKETILIVDDNTSERALLELQLKKWGFSTLQAEDGIRAMEALANRAIHLVISDQEMPEIGGLDLLKWMKEHSIQIPFIMLTAHSSVDHAVFSIKEGANDYIEKPYDEKKLKAVIQKALDISRLEEENKNLKKQIRNLYSFNNIVTHSKAMEIALKLAEKIVASPGTVVAIFGESGTGKEVLARAIHSAGDQVSSPFVAINCAAIPETLLESELFGHVRGSFTGADKDRKGKFELAGQGTLLLDEIGDMPMELQAKLLRVLQERQFERIGSNQSIATDARIIISTHRNLADLVSQGKFREDLYHRVNTFPIHLPALRERKEDIPFLSDHFIEQFRKHLGKKIPGISEEAMKTLRSHDWPGNIRELKNCLERAAILSDGESIAEKHLAIRHRHSSNGFTSSVQKIDDKNNSYHLNFTFSQEEFSLKAIQKKALDFALKKCGGNKSRAANLLKVDRSVFYQK